MPNYQLHCWLWLLLLGQFTQFAFGDEPSWHQLSRHHIAGPRSEC